MHTLIRTSPCRVSHVRPSTTKLLVLRSRLARLILILTGGLAWAALPQVSSAFDNGESHLNGNHSHACSVAAELFSFPDLADNLERVMFGAWCEDETDHVYDTSGEWITIPHFWIADEGDEQINWWGAYGYENAWMKARILIMRSRDAYLGGNHAEGYHLLGHVCHLLADMTVPAHAHYDEHSDDAYENWMAGFHPHINADVAHVYGPVPEITEEILNQITASWGGISPGPRDLVPPLYFLMYTANQRADYFASDGDPGNLTDRHGWMNNYPGWPLTPRTTDDLVDCDVNDTDEGGKLSTIAYKCYTYGISATARLYEVWRDHIDHEPPQTGLTITGPAPVHNDWRPGSVGMTLTADDNYSGVHETRYGGYGLANKIYTAPVVIADEGMNFFSWQSMDRFGNEEELHQETILIDRTPPVVSILCPVPGGLYLSSGSLAIDFEAADEPSGIYRVIATLDGQPVVDGQTFDLALMAGFHTISVTAEDMAGNIATASVSFSVKIYATVQLQPLKFNLRSAGGILSAFVDFPLPYDVAQIDEATVILSAGGAEVPAEAEKSQLGHTGKDAELWRSFKFERQLLCQALAGQSGSVAPVVSGNLINGVEFWGTGILEILSEPE